MLEKVLDSHNFTVGGGVSAALSGAMAAGSVGMVANLSLKKDYGLTKERYEEIIERTKELIEELKDGAVQDENGYLEIRDAYKLKKSTDEEKEKRKKAIEDAGISAATVPKENGFRCREVYELAMELKGDSNPNCGSDLEVAIMLAEVGIKGCILNIEVNLPLIKNPETKAQFEKDIEELKNFKGGN